MIDLTGFEGKCEYEAVLDNYILQAVGTGWSRDSAGIRLWWSIQQRLIEHLYQFDGSDSIFF